MKKLLALLLVFTMLFTLTACGNSDAGAAGDRTPVSSPESSDPFADGPTVNLTFANNWSDVFYWQPKCIEVCEWIKEQSGGKINIYWASAGEFGADGAMAEAVLNGDIAFASVTASGISPYVPEAAIYEMPMLFSSPEEAYEATELYEPYAAEFFAAKGFVFLGGTVPAGFRYIGSTKEINSYEDLSHTAIRVMSNKYHIEFWNAVGASSLTMSPSECTIAMSQGLCDAWEQILPVHPLYRDVTKYHYDTNVSDYFVVSVANPDVWNSLPAAYQDLIMEGLDQITAYFMENYDQALLDATASIEEVGGQVISIDDDFRAKLEAASASSYELLRADIGDDPVDKMLDCIDQVQ